MKIIKWLDQYFEEVLMMIFLPIIIVMMGAQVIMRYVVGYSLSFPEEISRYSFIWLSYLGVSYAVKTDQALKVDIIHTLVPKLKKPLDILGDIAYFAFFAYMIVPGFNAVMVTKAFGSASPALNIPIWILYSSLLLGSVLACVRMIQKYVKMYLEHKKKNYVEEGEVK